MSKHRHSKDKLYVTYSEHQMERGGKKQEIKTPLSRLPFDCCALALEPFQTPYCSPDGCVFDMVNIVPFIKKYGKNPVTGQNQKLSDLIELHFYKNEKGEYHDPISFKIFTDHTKLVAIRQTGNVYSADTVDELNRKNKNWKDLLNQQEFTYKDIITLQDPKNIEQRTIKNFDYLQKNLQIEKAQLDNTYINLGESARRILDLAQEETKKRLAQEELQEERKKEEKIQDQQKIRSQIQNNEISVEEFLKVAATSGDYLSERYATEHDSVSVTSTHMVLRAKPLGEVTYRNMTAEEIRKVLYDRIRKSGQKGYVQLITNYGNINLELHCDHVPMTCQNYIELCEKGYYNKTKFHKLAQNELVEGGDPTATGYGGESIFGKPFRIEINNLLSHNKAGMLSMGNLGPNHQTSLFFITLAECKKYDTKYSVFGEVVGGFQTLYNINKLEVNMWQRPDMNIRIKEVKVIKNPFREMIKIMMQEKDNEKDEKIHQLKKQKLNERYLEDDEFKIPEKPVEQKTKGLGLAQQLIQQFSNQEVAKKQTKQYSFDSWI